MPLTRKTVTAASRIMLPAYVILSAVFGLVYVFDPFGRLDGVHALAFQRRLTGGSMVVWGLIFLGLAVLMLVAFTRHSRLLFAFALCCCAFTWFLWGCAYTASVVIDPQTSILAPVLPWFVTACCTASSVSLLKREV